jgi:sulfur carrier protein
MALLAWAAGPKMGERLFLPFFLRAPAQREHFSVNIIVNGEARQASGPLTVAQLLSELNLPARGVAVEVNLQIVPRSQHEERLLQDGDRLEVVSLVGGG